MKNFNLSLLFLLLLTSFLYAESDHIVQRLTTDNEVSLNIEENSFFVLVPELRIRGHGKICGIKLMIPTAAGTISDLTSEMILFQGFWFNGDQFEVAAVQQDKFTSLYSPDLTKTVNFFFNFKTLSGESFNSLIKSTLGEKAKPVIKAVLCE